MSLDRLTQITSVGITSGITLQNINVIGVVTATTLSASEGITVTGVVTASSFSGNVTGNLTGNVTGNVNASGVSTFSGGIQVSGSTTSLVVNGNARITGILTIGTSSITLDGSNNEIKVGAAATISNSQGFVGSGTNLTGLNASNLGSGTIPDARFPATLPAVSGANLTGISPFAAGTLMLFQQTAAPTGWTKQTTHDNKALRVVSGSASSGGTTAFTSVFASRTPSGSVSVSGSNSNGSIANTTVTGSVSGSNSGGSVSNTTLSTSQISAHNHGMQQNTYGGSAAAGGSGTFANTWIGGSYAGVVNLSDMYTTNTGGSGAHNHGFTNPSWSGSVSMNAHNHTFTNPTWSGSASFSGSSMDFAVQYVDLIIASKN